jgi:hypothetical protein
MVFCEDALEEGGLSCPEESTDNCEGDATGLIVVVFYESRDLFVVIV